MRIENRFGHFVVYPFEDSWVWHETTPGGYPVDKIGTAAFVPLFSAQDCLTDIVNVYENPSPMHGQPYPED